MRSGGSVLEAPPGAEEGALPREHEHEAAWLRASREREHGAAWLRASREREHGAAYPLRSPRPNAPVG